MRRARIDLLPSETDYTCWGCGLPFEVWMAEPATWDSVMRPYCDITDAYGCGVAGWICAECFHRISNGDVELGILQAMVGLEIRRRQLIDGAARSLRTLRARGPIKRRDRRLARWRLNRLARRIYALW